MDYEVLFTAVNIAVLPGWLLLAAAPGRRVTEVAVHSGLWSGILAALYTALLATNLGGPGGFGSLAELSVLFGNPAVLLAGWVHYLAFDLWVGAWIAREGLVRGVPRGLVWVCLGLTLMAGPAGFLTYLVARARVWRGDGV